MYAPDTTHMPGAPVIDDGGALVSLEDSAMDQPLPESLATAVALPKSDDVLKVSTRSRPSAVAGAIAGVMRQHSYVEVQCIGAGATNQAIKAIAIARAYLRDDHINVGCVPFFMDIAIDGEERTALRLVIERYPD
jgi:stage V sporulation protein S